MAKYEHLPIYRKAFELTVAIENLVHGFSRHHKYGLGSRLQQAAIGLLERVVRAQNAGPKGRVAQLEDLRVEVEVLKNLLHLGKEVRAFKSFGAYERIAGMAVEIGRQAEGWLRSALKLQSPESRPTNSKEGRS